jgi:hypothetical protein
MAIGRVLLILGAYLAFCGVLLWRQRRDRRRQELLAQLWAMERAIWEESLPDEEREVLQEARARCRDRASPTTLEARGPSAGEAGWNLRYR